MTVARLTRASLAVGACLFLGGRGAASEPAPVANLALQAPAADLIDRAKETARLIEDPDAAGPAWAEIASALALSGDVVGAKKLAGNVADDAWKAEIFKSVALAQVRREDLVGALATATSIGEDDAKCEALLEVALGYVRAGDLPRAKQTLTAARLARVSEYLGGLAPRIACVQAAVGDLPGATRSVLATTGDLDRALANCELLVGLSLGGNAAAAKGRLGEARRQVAALADGGPRNRALVKLVAAQAAAGEADTALKTASEITEARGRTDAYLEIADRSGKLAVRRDAYRKAWTSAEGILQNVTRAVAWCRIGGVASACGESDDALELLRKGREVAEALPDPRDRVRGLSTVVRLTPGSILATLAKPTARSAGASAAFRSLVLTGLRSPRPGFALPSAADRPHALVAASRAFLSQVEPLVAGRAADGEKLRTDVGERLESLDSALKAGDAARVESVLAELLGTPTDPTSLFKTMEERLALAPEQVDSLEEERSLNAFLLAREVLTLLRTSGDDPSRARVGAAVRDLHLALASLALGAAERDAVYLPLTSGKRSLGEFVRLLDEFSMGAGALTPEKTAAIVREVLEQLSEDSTLPERVRHPRLVLAIGALRDRLESLPPATAPGDK